VEGGEKGPGRESFVRGPVRKRVMVAKGVEMILSCKKGVDKVAFHFLVKKGGREL